MVSPPIEQLIPGAQLAYASYCHHGIYAGGGRSTTRGGFAAAED